MEMEKKEEKGEDKSCYCAVSFSSLFFLHAAKPTDRSWNGMSCCRSSSSC